ncbi:MAG: glycoside hydrolase family 5 protein [Fibrobacterales bacterium]
MHRIHTGILLFAVIVLILSVRPTAATPVNDHGQLQVIDGYLHDEHGNSVQLQGVSLFWNQWSGRYWNAELVNWLATEWRIDVLRVPVGAGDGDGTYYFDFDEDVPQAELVIQAAINAGIYVMIDWHGHHATDHGDDAWAFFSYFSEKYGDYPNIIYEVFNEPLDHSWGEIKNYTEGQLVAIRANDPNNVVIAGTGFYDTEPHEVIDQDAWVTYDYKVDPNVMYSIHVYAGNNMPDDSDPAYRNFNHAISNGLPVFMTEFGVDNPIVYPNTPDLHHANMWVDWMNHHRISYASWSIKDIDDANRTSNFVMPHASEFGGWTDDDLSVSGKWVRDLMLSSHPDPYDPTGRPNIDWDGDGVGDGIGDEMVDTPAQSSGAVLELSSMEVHESSSDMDDTQSSSLSEDIELPESSSSEGIEMPPPSSESMSSEESIAPLKEGVRVRPTLQSVPFIYREGKANVVRLNPETLKYSIVSPDGTVWQSGVNAGSEAEGGVVPVQSLPTGLYLLIQE